MNESMEGQESVVFLAPMGAHNAIAIEAWQVVAQWDVQTVEGVVNAVRYGTYPGDPEHTQTLANLKTRVTTAAGSDAFANKRIANASGLQQYYREIGAYGDITPDDGETTTFTPAQPPPMRVCANGTAVPNPGDNRALVQDCGTLLELKDTLVGTATLNWSASTALASWDGVTTGGTPSRVTRLRLANKSLSGSIPAALGTLYALTHLDLSSNSLTGAVPAELGVLENLVELKLAGNSFTDCLPLALEGLATTDDLGSLSLLFCMPPTPTNFQAGAVGETSVDLSWDAVANTSKYRLEHWDPEAESWTVSDDTLTATTHTLTKLACASAYRLRVSAFGSGTTYAAVWSEASTEVAITTTACVTPVFDEEEYNFAVREDAAVGTAVGDVTATDPNAGDTVSYSITAGNEGGEFAIDANTGAITVAAALDAETTASYTLTVAASDGTNAGTIMAEIAVDELAPAPSDLSVTLAEGTFSLSWTAVTDADKYRVEYRTGGDEGEWTRLDETTATSQTFSPDDGPACETTYDFRVQARGDGETYVDDWGEASESVSHTTGTCNLPPMFTVATYTFSVREDASPYDTAGIVLATDPDGDFVAYHITAGNEAGRFHVSTGSAGESSSSGARWTTRRFHRTR